jgi:hypothetical protein
VVESITLALSLKPRQRETKHPTPLPVASVLPRHVNPGTLLQIGQEEDLDAASRSGWPDPGTPQTCAPWEGDEPVPPSDEILDSLRNLPVFLAKDDAWDLRETTRRRADQFLEEDENMKRWLKRFLETHDRR